ncbi:MAG: CPBP family intramembrane metalloprotease [Ignavibacteriales bacterium]|nr:CPBP family intramembrane metalloprotease [Ignavibacteriales bacterium]
MQKFKEDIKKLLEIIKSLDKKVVTIFITVGVVQTISWYYTSRRFFRANLYYDVFGDNPNVEIYEFMFWFIGDFVTLFILPVLIIKIFLKEKIVDFGIKFGDVKTGLKYSLIFLAFMIPIIWFISASPAFAVKYPHLQSAKIDWTLLLIYEMGMLLYMFSWEFIWRGFMLFGLEVKFGYYAVLIQMIPFVILHNGKPDIETFSSILGGIALGILALKTRSFIYGVIVHMGIMLSIDLFSTLRYRANEFGVGLDSFIKIISELF